MTDMRLFVGFKLAGLYPEGTIITDRKGVNWVSWRPDSYVNYDYAPGWKKLELHGFGVLE